MDYVMTWCEVKEVRQMTINWQFELTSLHLILVGNPAQSVVYKDVFQEC